MKRAGVRTRRTRPKRRIPPVKGTTGPRAGRRHSKGRQRPTSILLHDELIEKLKAKAARRGIGYQTMLKIIVHENLEDY